MVVWKTLFTFVPECSEDIVYVRSRMFERHHVFAFPNTNCFLFIKHNYSSTGVTER